MQDGARRARPNRSPTGRAVQNFDGHDRAPGARRRLAREDRRRHPHGPGARRRRIHRRQRRRAGGAVEMTSVPGRPRPQRPSPSRGCRRGPLPLPRLAPRERARAAASRRPPTSPRGEVGRAPARPGEGPALAAVDRPDAETQRYTT